MGFIFYQQTRPLNLPNNLERSQEIYAQVLTNDRVAAIMDVLAAKGITVDLSDAFYQTHQSDIANIETITVFTSSGHLLGFGVRRDRFMNAFLVGQEGDDVYAVDLLSSWVARAEVAGQWRRLKEFREGDWQADTSLASLTTVGQAITEVPFYDVNFPSRYIEFVSQFRPYQTPYSLNIDIDSHNESMCSVDELSRKVRTLQAFFYVAIETNISLKKDYNKRATQGALRRFEHTLNACSGNIQSPLCNFWLRRVQAIWGDYSGGLAEQRHITIKNGFSYTGRILESEQPRTRDFLTGSGCIPLIADELALELSAHHGELVTARDNAFIFNDVDTTAPYLITTAGSFFEVTSYIADGEIVDDLPLILPADSPGGVEIVARCPSQDTDTPAQIYEGIILATPPVGEAALLGVSLECL
ncbi:MAG: hypothetical protein AAF267_05510 [Deinococcota bacterium]